MIEVKEKTVFYSSPGNHYEFDRHVVEYAKQLLLDGLISRDAIREFIANGYRVFHAAAIVEAAQEWILLDKQNYFSGMNNQKFV